jgi:mannose-6-phosphate isomerase-like protein (cupin superfamily)
MSNYAIKNIREIDDSAKEFGLSPHVEARFGRKALHAEKGGFSYQKLEPGFRQPFGHKHGSQEEIYVVISGDGRMKIGEEVVDVKPWDSIRVSADTPRAFEGGSNGIEFLAFGAGESGDTDMIEDFWPQNGDRG